MTIELSHPERVLWPEDGLTKGDLAAYYRAVAPVMLPHLRDRPVTLRVFPRGIDEESHYRRDLPDDAPDSIRRVPYVTATKRREIELPVIDDLDALLWFVDNGTIEFHHWPARAPELTTPDLVIFDLDPGDRASFTDVIAAALILRDALVSLDLTGYPKTSGGRGLHVYFPVATGASFEEVRNWVKELAGRLEAAHPKLIATSTGSTHRGALVTIDHAQNSQGRNTAAPYTARARAGAPVSAPLTWDEVEKGTVRPEDWTIRTLPERIDEVGDLFAGVLEPGDPLPPLER